MWKKIWHILAQVTLSLVVRMPKEIQNNLRNKKQDEAKYNIEIQVLRSDFSL